MCALAGALLGCALRRQRVVPYRVLSEPEGLIHYTLPGECFWAYSIEAPHIRESIGVLHCWKARERAL